MTTVNFPPEVGGDDVTLDDTDNPSTGLGNGGHRTRFMIALSQFVKVALWVKETALAVIGYRDQASNSADSAATSATNAAVSEANALSYLTAYRATSYGALATDPVLDPNGNAPTVGDEYYNTTANLLKRFNGATWQASDISTANLAAPSGSALVGFLLSSASPFGRTVAGKLQETVSIRDFGAIGDGNRHPLSEFFGTLAAAQVFYPDAKALTVPIDVAAIQAAANYLKAAGGGKMIFPKPTVGYVIDRLDPAVQLGPRIEANITLEGQGLTNLILAGNCGFFKVQSLVGSPVTITANTVPTDFALQVADGTGFAMGDKVLVRIGQAAYDAGEPDYWYFAKVVSAAAGSVTLDAPCNYTLNAASVTNTNNRSVMKITSFVEHVTFRNLRFYDPNTGGANAEFGVRGYITGQITMEDCAGYNPGAGILYTQYVENVDGNTISIERSVRQSGQGSKGRCFNFAETKNVRIKNATARDFEGNFYVGEGGNKNVRFENVHLINTFPGRAITTALFGLLGERSFLCDGLYVEGNQTALVDTGGTAIKPDGEWFRNLVMEPTTCDITSTIVHTDAAKLGGLVKLGATLLGPIRVATFEIDLMPSQAGRQVNLPAGWYRRVRFKINDKSGLTNLYIGNTNNINVQMDPATLVNGVAYDASALYSGIGRDYPFNDVSGKRVIYYTDATVQDKARLLVEVEYFADLSATGSGEAQVFGKAVQTLGQRQAASSLGAVTGRVQVFDATGVSLGYLPVYSSIT